MNQKRRKKKINKKTVLTVIILLIVAAAAIFMILRSLKKKVKDEYASSDETTVQTAEVTTGSISTTVTGSGTLVDQDSEEVDIPASVTMKKVYVESGDTVEKGDLLASVDSASVMEAMSDIQDQMAEIDEELADAADDEVDSTITAPVDGRVKDIYVEKKDDVASVMYDEGALMLLSLDGYMAVDVETDKLSKGDSVTVTEKKSGTSYTGTVEKVVAGVATVLISDKTAANGTKVKVTSDDKNIGSGKLYIHESLAITGYAGTVSSISVKENASVDEGDTLIKLTDTSYSANYASLLTERQDLEDDLQELVTIYKEGAVYAPCAGTVKTVTDVNDSDNNSGDTSSTSTSSQSAAFSMTAASASQTSTADSTSTSTEDSTITICPDEKMYVSVDVDESNILSISVGQEATVTIDSLSDQTFTGEVTDIDTNGSSSNGVTTYTVEIKVEKDASMMSGMTASVTITIEGVENALLVPEEAVHKTSSTAYVYTSYDEESGEFGDMVEVTLGITDGSYYEITDGLSEGDTVYYTESDTETDAFANFGGGKGDFGGMSGGGSMPSGGGNMPSGGGMPSGGRNHGGQ